MELDLQLEYWDRIGPTKHFAHPVNIVQLSHWLRPADRILDFGCGYGRALNVLKARGFDNLIGMDPAPSMIATARKQFPAIEFAVLHDFRKVPLENASVDAVLLFAVLTCVPGNNGQEAIIREVTRVLRPGGILYISDVWLQTDERNVRRYERDAGKYGIYGVFDLPDGATVRHHDRQWLGSLLAGYEVLAVGEIDMETMNGNPISGFQWFGRRLA